MKYLQLFQSSIYEHLDKDSLNNIDDKYSDKISCINLWCHDLDNKVNLVSIDNYEIPFYLRFSNNFTGEYVRDPFEIKTIIRELNRRISEYITYLNRIDRDTNIVKRIINRNVITKYKIEEKFPIYYYSEQPSTFIKAYFKTVSDYKYFTGFLRKKQFISVELKNYKINYLEVNKDVLPVMKFLTENNMKHTGWITLDDTNSDYCIHITDPQQKFCGPKIEEYITIPEMIKPVNDEKYKNIQINPSHLSWDIETYSDDGTFTKAEKLSNVCYMISVVTEIIGKIETRKCALFLYGEYSQEYIKKSIDEDKLSKETEIFNYDNEYDMLVAFQRYFIEYDPTLISGYNIVGFDFAYVEQRLFKEKIGMYDRVSNKEIWLRGMSRHSDPYFTPEMASINWKSSAFGENEIKYLMMEGRICIDMLNWVRRDYKLKTYSLKAVTNHFFKDDRQKKIELSAHEMFAIYGKWLEFKDNEIFISENPNEWNKILHDMSVIIEYCIRDSVVVCELIKHLNTWVVLNQFASVMNCQISDLIFRGQQMKCFNSIYRIAEERNFVMDYRECNNVNCVGGYVQEPISGINDNVICVDFSSLYPSIMLAYNLCYSTLIRPSQHDSPSIDHIKNEIVSFTIDQQEPVSGIIKVKEDDSLTSFSEISNVVVNDDSDSDSEETPNKNVKENPKRKKKQEEEKITKRYHFKWISKNVREGIIPATVKKLLDERKAVRKEQSKYNPYDDVYKLLESKQLSLKLLANSIYGFVGVANNPVRALFEMAMTICYVGRTSIMKVNNSLAEKFGAITVYNDTDSAMVKIKDLTDSRDCHYYGNLVMQYINGYSKGDPMPKKYNSEITEYYDHDQPRMFPSPMGVEFEKAMRQLCIKKKKYAYLNILKDGSFEKDPRTGKFKVIFRGLDPARRDKCEVLTNAYKDLLYKLLSLDPIQDNIDYVFDVLTKLFTDQFPIDNYTIVKSVREKYKLDSAPMKVFTDRLIKFGEKVKPGDRIEYLIADEKSLPWCKDIKNVRISERYITKSEYITKKEEYEQFLKFKSENSEKAVKEKYPADCKPYLIDYIGYLERTLTKPLDQLFLVCYPEIMEKFKKLRFTNVRKQYKNFSKGILDFVILYIKETRKIKELQSEDYQKVINNLHILFRKTLTDFGY